MCVVHVVTVCRTFDDVDVTDLALKVGLLELWSDVVGSSCCFSQECYLSSPHCWKIPIKAFP